MPATSQRGQNYLTCPSTGQAGHPADPAHRPLPARQTLLSSMGTWEAVPF